MLPRAHSCARRRRLGHSLSNVFNQESPANCESAVTKVRRNAEAVAARNTSPGSDSGNSIPAASAATAKLNGASLIGTRANTMSSQSEKLCLMRNRWRRTRWRASQIETGDKNSSFFWFSSCRRTARLSFSGECTAQIQMCVSRSNCMVSEHATVRTLAPVRRCRRGFQANPSCNPAMTLWMLRQAGSPRQRVCQNE
jgi:hypothetical protein